jgi:LuxR family maltose regulon positive regulatory protein
VPPGWLRQSVEYTSRLAAALIAIERLELVAAGELISAANDVEAPSSMWAFGAYAAARYGLYTGDPVAGLRRLDQARARHADRLGEGATAGPLLTAVEADLLLAAGRGNEAAAVLDQGPVDHPLLRVGRARLLLLSGDPSGVLQLAKDITWARRVGRRQQMDMMVVQAIAHHRLAQPRAAAEALSAALAAARVSGALRPFATVPRAELDEIAAKAPVEATGILDAAALRAATRVFPTRVGLVQLTARERMFLEHLATGAGLAQIAQKLFISLNTAKSHTRSLYRKLEANSREDALRRAAELGLLGRTAGDRRPS